MLHLEFAAHAVLIALMLAASLIDVDEKIIPDEITIPGTLVGLLLAAAWPRSLLPDAVPMGGGEWGLDFLHLTSPNRLARLAGRRPANGLAGAGTGLLVAVVRGAVAAVVVRAARLAPGGALCWARIVRDRSTYRILRMALMGSLAIAVVWFRGGLGWQGLLTALVGMAASGGLVWLVRIIGTAALRREAMGFGDVTLMAMIGAYLGWQPCLVVFFLAPLAGLVVGAAAADPVSRPGDSLRPVPLLGDAFSDRPLAEHLGLHPGHFHAGLARAAADARLPGADGADAEHVAADPRRVPLDRRQIAVSNSAGRCGQIHGGGEG